MVICYQYNILEQAPLIQMQQEQVKEILQVHLIMEQNQ